MATTDDDAPSSDWPNGAIEIAEMVWGEGFHGPGDGDYIRKLVLTLGLSPESSFLEFGSGGGGGARAVAQRFGAYVTACETDPDLVARGNVLATVYDLEAKASITQVDLDALDLRERFYTGALLRDMLYTVENKPALLGAVVGAVKQGAEIVITDLVAEDPGAARLWASLEPEPIYLWSPKDAQTAMARAQIQVRKSEDHSEEYVEMVLRAFQGFLRRLEEERPPPAVLGPSVDYVERWGRRLAEIQAGRLAYYRFHGLARRAVPTRRRAAG